MSLFLPSTLPLLPFPPPQVLFPYLRVSLVLPAQQLALVLNSIAENTRTQKLDDGSRLLAVVPVVEIERRVGRWATAARVVKVEKAKDQDGHFRLILEGLVSSRVRARVQGLPFFMDMNMEYGDHKSRADMV